MKRIESMPAEFLASLQRDAFSNQLSSPYPLDLQGWLPHGFQNAFGDILDSIVNQKKQGEEVIIIEIGTWKGLSAHTMATIAKTKGVKVKIICIDTWLGAPEFWTYLRGHATHDLKKDSVGYPTVYHTFINNMVGSGISDVIYPLPLPSQQALDVIKFYNLRADIIYVDAAHEYEPVRGDILGYWEILTSSGVMFGDDYNPPDWPGVVKAVNSCAETLGVSLMLSGIMWRLQSKQ
jgi:hypothetical protein